MRSLLLVVFWLVATVSYAHEIEGAFSRGGPTSNIPRTRVPFDSSAKVSSGRVYTLWIAPDGAFVFYLERPSDRIDLVLEAPDSRFRVWLVEARRELTLPEGFEQLDADRKGEVDGVQELTGKIRILWNGDSNYAIGLDVAGKKDQATFKGFLFGSSSNVPPPTGETEPNKPVQINSVDAPRKSRAVTAISRSPRSV